MNKILKFFNETKEGRIIKRCAKTFFYTATATYVALRTSPFQVDWSIVIEAGMLSALGFGTHKGLKEYTYGNIPTPGFFKNPQDDNYC